MIYQKCPNCGADMSNCDPRARTCSARCRKAMSRRRQTVDRAVYQIDSALLTLRLALKNYPDLAEDINPALARIESDVRDLRKLRPDADMRALIDLQYDRSRKL